MGFVSLTEALDLTTPAGRAMAGLLAIFAQFEREILRERTRAVMKRPKRDTVREDRIYNEAIIDARPEEQAMSWFYYLEDKISFRPFLFCNSNQ